ncbi:ankyrin repeat domain-containing protein [Rhizobacter sp. Root1221]|uniref:ankyrin repeat domain-containing protein n=1 Tax=Rhizobacter sp. Root1221 TaxID=1736433 RepID=UPI0007006622|nr:ankyrin repeat domain-containing protein [Rhizobacter sp. Root1221]KQV97209.1 hypothetical protein ASC87_23710 [Rhizobacter sp. Root1221]
MKRLAAGLLSLVVAACAAAPLTRCPEPPEGTGFGDYADEAVKRATQDAPAIAFVLGKGRRAELAALLARGDDPNACLSGISMLAFSASFGEQEEVRMLLDAGARTDRPLDSNGDTPLFAALSSGHYGAAELLLARGANPRHVGDFGATALHRLSMAPVPTSDAGRAQQHRWAARLLALGLTVDVRLHRGSTPLMLATAMRNRELADFLLARGADPDAQDNRGSSPVALARKRGEADWIELFERAKAAGASR